MNRTEQKNFVRELSETIVTDILNQIDREQVPDDWDGLELRLLLAYRHEQSASMSHSQMRTRKRKFNNTVLVNNL